MRGVKPKLHEVAKQAEVSEATVSRVLNQRPGVAEETRRRVLDVLNKLGYNFGSEGFRKLRTVGIITPELDNPIFPLLAQAIESKLARHGFLSLLGPATPTTAHERDYLQHFVRMGASGVVVVNGAYAKNSIGYAAYERLLDSGIAVVLVNGIYGPCPVPAVTVDIAAAAHSAVRHLINLGHRRIGCIPGELQYTSPRDLVAGYERALRGAKIPVDDDLVIETLFTLEGAKSAALRLIDSGVSGMIAISDLMAVGAIGAASSQGIRVPEDLSVIGFDGTPLVGLRSPTLTTLRQPVNRMAQSVTAMLLGQMDDDLRPTTQVFEADLIAGGTAGIAPTLVR
jgi:alanine racemase